MRTELFTNCVDLVGSACRPFDGTKCYVSTGAVDTDHIDDCNIEIVDYVGKPSRANLEVDPGDVLFAKMQGTKKTLLIDSELANHIYSTGFCAVRAKEDLLNRRCLFHLLSSEAFLAQKDRNCSGATQKAITNAGLKKIVIKVPNIEKQDSIADQLDCISRIIEKRKKELETLDELIKARFVEMFGDIANNSLNLKEVTVADCCKMTQGTQIPMADQISEYQEGYYRYLYIRDLKYDNDDWIYVRDQYDEKKMTERDLVVVNTGNTAGEIYRGKDGILSNNLFKVSFDSELLLPTYLFYYFRSEAFQKMLWSEMKEGTQPHLGHKIFGSKKLLIPHIYAQEQFESFVRQVDKSKVAVQKSLDETQLLFDSLMQEYFN